MKIKLAQKLKGSTEEVSVQALIEDENNLLIEIDKNHAENTPPNDDRKLCYGKFDKLYESAENLYRLNLLKKIFPKQKVSLKEISTTFGKCRGVQS